MLNSKSSELLHYVKEYPFPTDILIETTMKCNLRCKMCPRSMQDRAQGDMSLSLWRKIIDEVAEVSPDTNIWPSIFGEPFMLKEKIFDYIKYAKDKAIKNVCMNTNLTLFTPDLIEPLFNSRVDEVIVGLDSVNKETYNKIRVGGDLDAVLRNIHLIVEEKAKRNLTLPRITVQFVVLDENEAEYESFIDYWKKLRLGLRLKLRHKSSWGGVIKSSKKDDETQRIPCLWLLRQFSICWDGMVSQCNSMRGPFIGNINNSSIVDLWNGTMKNVIKRHLNSDFDFFPCNECDDWKTGKSLTVET